MQELEAHLAAALKENERVNEELKLMYDSLAAKASPEKEARNSGEYWACMLRGYDEAFYLLSRRGRIRAQ